MADPAIKYGNGINFADANTSHSRMLRLVGGDNRVLEFGCSTGYMSRALSDRGCVVTGVEIDPTAAEVAKEVCERVIVADLDRDDWAGKLGDVKFDAVLFGDVLEHLKNPQAVLARVKDFIADGGFVVASIPNIAHGSVRLALLDGEFQYRRLGLLDDTHLRFFTRKTIDELFQHAGYALEVVERAKLGIFDTEIRLNQYRYPPSLIKQLHQDEDALTYQYICKAFPRRTVHTSGDNKSGNVVSFPAAQNGSAYVDETAQQLAEADARIRELESQVAARDATIHAITTSKGWRLLNRYRELKIRLLSLAKPLRTLAPMHGRTIIDQKDYDRWIQTIEKASLDRARMEAALDKFEYRPLVSIIMPVFNTRLDDLKRAVASLEAQLYENWQLCICDDASTAPHIKPFLMELATSNPRVRVAWHETNQGISVGSNSALQLAEGEFVGFLDHDDELAAHALFEVVALLQEHRDADMIYSDEDKLDPNGRRCDPFFKPDWSPEYMLSCMYTCHFGVYRKSAVTEIGGLRRGFEGSQDYDLVLRLAEKTSKIFHVPKILYHWRQTPTSTASSARAKDYATEAGRKALQEHLRRRGVEGVVRPGAGPNRYHVSPTIKGDPLVSIIIPTKDQAPVLKRCVDSITGKTAYKKYELVVIDNNSEEPATEQYLKTLGDSVVKFPQPFNFSRINNFAAQKAKGDYLLFLNNDTEVISPDWLGAMLEYAQLPEIGAVGAKLYYPDRRLQHGGVVLGIGGVAGHSHKYFGPKSRGYFDSLVCIRNYSAVTAACVMIRRDVFEKVRGFDEQLAVAFNDVDLCVRIREAGYRIVWTPYAELYHHESVSRGFNLNPAEIALMLERWGDLLKHDPYYNPNLTLVHENYSLAL